MICSHCKSENNNFYYCKGCGRKLEQEHKTQAKEIAQPHEFIEEVIDIIEKKFYPAELGSIIPMNSHQISLEEMSKDEGIFLIGSEQWREASQTTQNSCFFSEIFFLYMFSSIITMIGYIAGADSIEMIFQLYVSVFLALSFTVWFIIPYFSGFSAVSSVMYRCSMFLSSGESVKNHAKPLFTIFLFSAVPYVFVIPFINSLIKSKFSAGYKPKPLSLSGINYMEKINTAK